MIFDNINFLFDSVWPYEIFKGFLVTILVSVAGFIFSIFLGSCFLYMSTSPYYALRFLQKSYVNVFRNMPELIIIFVVFYGLSGYINILLGLKSGSFASSLINGTFALGLISGTYVTEIFRGAYNQIPKTHIEAAVALGMRKFLIFERIIMPQVIGKAVPALFNIWLVITKDSAILSVIGLSELMFVSDIASGSSKKPFLFYIIAVCLYLCITYISQVLFNKYTKLKSLKWY